MPRRGGAATGESILLFPAWRRLIRQRYMGVAHGMPRVMFFGGRGRSSCSGGGCCGGSGSSAPVAALVPDPNSAISTARGEDVRGGSADGDSFHGRGMTAESRNLTVGNKAMRAQALHAHTRRPWYFSSCPTQVMANVDRAYVLWIHVMFPNL